MDIPREPKSKKGRYIWITLVAILVIAATIMLRRLEPAAPTVDQAIIWTGMVQRGDMLRQVSGNGNLVPVNIVIVSSVTGGRVEEVLVLPGATVEPGTALLRLSNPDVELELLEAQRQLTVAEGELETLRGTLITQVLNQKATVAHTDNEYRNAQRQLAAYLEVPAEVSTLELERAKDLVNELKIRLDVENQRLDLLSGSQDREIKAKQSQVERLRQIADFQRNRFESLNVKAGTKGVVRELALQVGETVSAGRQLGVIIQPGRLKAVVRVQENQARDVVIGQTAVVDSRPVKIEGHVTRIDPAAQGGSVLVDISLDGEVPQGVYADQNVDAVITIEKLDDILYVGRPINVQQGQRAGIFKIVDDGAAAVRISVQFGRSSVDKIEIKSGAEGGDELILSDMSRHDEVDRVRIKR